MPAPQAPCTICETLTDQRCSVCKSAQYCSKQCQAADWPLHKLLCQKFRPFLATRPGRTVLQRPFWEQPESFDYKLALLFPYNGEAPELIWVEVRVVDQKPEGSWEGVLHVLPIDPSHDTHDVGSSAETLARIKFTIDPFVPRKNLPEGKGNCLYQRQRRYWQFCPFDKDQVQQGNRCLQNLKVGYSFTGHYDTKLPSQRNGDQVVVLWSLTLGGAWLEDDQYYHDMTLSDLRCSIEEISVPRNTLLAHKPNPYNIHRSDNWIKAVRVSSLYEVEVEAMNQFLQMKVAPDHEVFSKFDGDCSMTQHLGCPLHIMKSAPLKTSGEAMENEEVEHWLSKAQLALVTELETGIYDWGEIDFSKWGKRGVGLDQSFIVARKDKEGITAQQVESLVQYYQDVLSDEIWLIKEEILSFVWEAEAATSQWLLDKPKRKRREVTKKFIEEYLTPEKFSKFFKELKEKKLAEGEKSWTNALPPHFSKVVESNPKDAAEPQVQGKSGKLARPRKQRKPAGTSKATKMIKKPTPRKRTKTVQSVESMKVSENVGEGEDDGYIEGEHEGEIRGGLAKRKRDVSKVDSDETEG